MNSHDNNSNESEGSVVVVYQPAVANSAPIERTGMIDEIGPETSFAVNSWELPGPSVTHNILS
eukprot:gene43135-53541_t